MKRCELSDKQIDRAFRRYDIRNKYPEFVNEELAYRVGRALVVVLGKRGKEVLVGRDMRLSSPSLFKALTKGICDQGGNVLDIGQVDSPGLYFASGKYKKAGAMITASHNPKEFNGIKLVRSGAEPLGYDSGLDEIKRLIKKNEFSRVRRKGKIRKKNIWNDYRRHIFRFVDRKKIGRFKVVIDGGNGMTGKVVPEIYSGLGVNVVRMNFKLDGDFPKHDANPAEVRNVKDLMNRVKKEKADFGIAFDADMDRVVFVDEKGRYVPSSITGALISKAFLEKRKGQKVVYSSSCSKIVRDIVRQYGGKSYIGKVGHLFIKEEMIKLDAAFGVEHTGHFYYGDNFHVDSGIITSLLVLESYSKYLGVGGSFSEMLGEFHKYYKLDEKSLKVKDKDKIIREIEKKFGRRAKVRRFDGLMLNFGDYWFNVRKSGTQNLLRINLEAKNKKVADEKMRELLNFIRKV